MKPSSPIISTLFLILFSLCVTSANAQSKVQIARDFLQKNLRELQLTADDLSDLKVSAEYTSKANGLTHIYFIQQYEGIEVNNAILNIHLAQDNRVVTYGNRFVTDLKKKINRTRAVISQEYAVRAAARELGYRFREPLRLKTAKGGAAKAVVFEKCDLSEEDIPVKLVYQPMEDGSVYLAWEVTIHEPSGENVWVARIDAVTGYLLAKDNLVVHCDFGPVAGDANFMKQDLASTAIPLSPDWFSPVLAGSYNVFPPPVESPNHGNRQIISNPADPAASPLGWHDTGGSQFTVTRGNNVHAYTDVDANNQPDPGSNPDGGPGLNFNFPLNLNQPPNTFRPAAVTNLFFWNNYLHDFAYNYGFDEQSGNFQVNNFGNGGAGSDDVRAEAQDGSGTNNANFFTPIDGSRPRMQMFIWDQGESSVTVNSPPPSVEYQPGNAAFGPLTFNISGDLELVDDGTAPETDGCEPLAGFTPGKIALIDRGICTFVSKVKNAQDNGAIAVIICNNVPGNPITMGGADPTITIPSLMLSLDNCNTIKSKMNSNTINVTMARTLIQFDCDFDNGVIAHEYAHGISNRFTGGPNLVGCLGNAEQMGEGWSDWYALMTTMEPGDQGTNARGIGTYVQGQPVNGQGIRPTPYSTDMSVNPTTYGDIGSLAVPHGVGYAWCGMIWDLSWALIQKYSMSIGFDRAMWLVNEGMKMQPCRPGFVDGRNAILAADMALYGGANQCLIWQVFARRGLGFSANQGLSSSVTDGTESFDLPPFMQSDSDCDNVPDYCDVCPGGDDRFDTDGDGIPNCADWNGISNVPAEWRCGPGNSLVQVCHTASNSHETLCLSPNAVPGHLEHGDMVGPCTSCNHQAGGPLFGETDQTGYITLFPNPASEEINVKLSPFEGLSGTILISDYLGQTRFRQDLNEMGGQMTIDISQFNPGVYLLMVHSDNKEMQSLKFMVSAK